MATSDAFARRRGGRIRSGVVLRTDIGMWRFGANRGQRRGAMPNHPFEERRTGGPEHRVAAHSMDLRRATARENTIHRRAIRLRR